MAEFNADQVFQMAERIEKNGARFYRLAADDVADPKARECLGRLAEMEDEHRRIFTVMRGDLLPEERRSTGSDPDGQTAAYLNAVADISLFDPESYDRILTRDGIEGVLQAAMALEKDSIVFYVGMKGMVPIRLGSDRVEMIIKEEMDHLVTLKAELARVRNK